MKILIADDDPSARLLLKSALADWGYDVVAVPDGIAAWEALRRTDAPPLALLDWLMPGLDGVEVCRKVRQESEAPFMYLVLLTGKAETQDVIQGIESGADDYVSKPFDMQELRVRLRAGQRIAELHRALLDQATHDSLTGVWNRRAVVEILERELARAVRGDHPVGVIMVDVDHFKRLNDTLGHADGDAALREVSRRVNLALRPSDSLGRYGGEEFLIVVPGGDHSSLASIAERVRQVIAEAEVTTPAGRTLMTVSLGAAIHQGPSERADGLIKRADDALYQAKRDGRNCVKLSTSASDPISRELIREEKAAPAGASESCR
jgi:two-component system, cell cycle response regulator